MSNIKSRVAKLEAAKGSGMCECGTGCDVTYTGYRHEGEEDSAGGPCITCGKPRHLIIVNYVQDWRPSTDAGDDLTQIRTF